MTGRGGGSSSSRGAESQSSSSRGASRRLLRELAVWEKEAPGEPGIERLGPVAEDELLRWEAVINGRGLGGGYDDGRWLLAITIPPTYPLAPPAVVFRTPVVHANVDLRSGEVCLDLLSPSSSSSGSGSGSSGSGGNSNSNSSSAWTPAYSVLEVVRAVRRLLAAPGVDSPLNVDVAALLRAGDSVAARRLVEFWCRGDADEGGRYEGR